MLPLFQRVPPDRAAEADLAFLIHNFIKNSPFTAREVTRDLKKNPNMAYAHISPVESVTHQRGMRQFSSANEYL